MKITFIVGNTYAAREDLAQFGILKQPEKRTISFDLTEEQTELLKLRVVGKRFDDKEQITKEVLEEILDIVFEEPKQ